MIKLFDAWSDVDNLDGFDCVRISWFCYGGNRKHPIADYSDVIRDYCSPDSAFKKINEPHVDEYLTAAEVEELKTWARHTAYEIKTEELSLLTCPRFMYQVL